MIFGKTNLQRHLEEQARLESMAAGIQKFAWLPTRLQNGERVRLQSYWRHYAIIHTENGWAPMSSCSDTFFHAYENHLYRQHIALKVEEKVRCHSCGQWHRKELK